MILAGVRRNRQRSAKESQRIDKDKLVHALNLRAR